MQGPGASDCGGGGGGGDGTVTVLKPGGAGLGERCGEGCLIETEATESWKGGVWGE